jgi:predicted small lipoprotein YifL
MSFHVMTGRGIMPGLIFGCLLLVLSACGNKGPLVPAGTEEQQKQEQQETETGAE